MWNPIQMNTNIAPVNISTWQWRVHMMLYSGRVQNYEATGSQWRHLTTGETTSVTMLTEKQEVMKHGSFNSMSTQVLHEIYWNARGLLIWNVWKRESNTEVLAMKSGTCTFMHILHKFLWLIKGKEKTFCFYTLFPVSWHIIVTRMWFQNVKHKYSSLAVGFWNVELVLI